jgi:branched-chain amino acid transport system substrate-binding protein
VSGRCRSWAGLVLWIGVSLWSATQATAEEEQTSTARRLVDAPAGFHGPTADPDSSLGDTASITLGVIAPGERLAGQELLAAVQLIVEAANADGGVGGRPIRIVSRTDDRPWHSAAHEVTRLILEDGAIAILGGLDGARAHAAELVVAKLWVPLISPTAADRSVDVANVPWVFRCAPDEQRQMIALVGVAYENGWQRLRLVTDDEREGRLARRALESAVDGLGIEVDTVPISDSDANLRSSSAHATILWTQRETALGWLARRPPDVVTQPLLLPLHLVAPDLLAAAGDTPTWTVALPLASGTVDAVETPGAWFVQAWHERFRRAPSAVAMLTADATLLLLSSIQLHGADPARLRQALATAHYAGLTGDLRFDALGGRLVKPEAMRLSLPRPLAGD